MWSKSATIASISTLRKFLGVVLLLTCGIAAGVEVETFPLNTIKARLWADVPAGQLTVLPVAKCGASYLPSEMAPAEFAARYPGGVYVVCDARVSDGEAHATILQYLFHASRNEVLVASSVDAVLSKRDRSWIVRTWRVRALDYAP